MARAAVETDRTVDIVTHWDLPGIVAVVEWIIFQIIDSLWLVAARLTEESSLPIFATAVARNH